MQPTVHGLEHVGITVPDVEKATDFFRSVFDAKICYDVLTPEDTPQQGESSEQRLGMAAGARVVHIRLLRIGNSSNIELFQIKGAEPQPAASLSDVGITHISFYVDHLEGMVDKFKNEGGRILSEPFALPGKESGPRNFTVYGQAPWGTLIEMITYSGEMDYPANSESKRWTPLNE